MTNYWLDRIEKQKKEANDYWTEFFYTSKKQILTRYGKKKVVPYGATFLKDNKPIDLDNKKD